MTSWIRFRVRQSIKSRPGGNNYTTANALTFNFGVPCYFSGSIFLGSWGVTAPSSMDADTVITPEQVLSFAAAPVPSASVDTASFGDETLNKDDAIMGDEGAHLKREFEEVDRPHKKMSPAKQGPGSTITSEDEDDGFLQMLMAAQPQVWDKEQREVETQKAPPDAFNTSAFGTIVGEGEDDADL
jgi:hypothetical protein